MPLHAFVDATQDAYNAVVYATCAYKDGSVSSNIAAAKTRVAPSVSTSIPRLELTKTYLKNFESPRDPVESVYILVGQRKLLWWIRRRSSSPS